MQGSNLNSAVTILFKEFGVRLRFTPTIVGEDLIHIKIAPEVSALDFSNAITLEGFRIPALLTRRTETEVELRDGQTFAIAGLIDSSLTETSRKIPGLGDIPILGRLFRSRAYQRNETELIVMITPHILRRDSVGVAAQLPDLVKPFTDPPARTLSPPPPSFAPPADVAEAEQRRLEEERERAAQERDAQETAARAWVKREAEAARVAAEAERKRLEEERKQAERERKEQERLEEERKQAERERKEQERPAFVLNWSEELQRLVRARAKREAEEAKLAAQVEQKR